MSHYIIDAEIKLKDNMTEPLEKASKKLEQSYRKTNKFANALAKASKSITSLGKNLTTYITLPITALATASITSYAHFEKAMLGIQNVTGATGEELKQLEDLALNMSMSTSKSAVECANGIEYLGLAGWETSDIMNNYAEILRLSEATGIDLAIASDLVTDSLASFGKAADFTSEYLNKLTLTSTKANANTQQLLESINICGGMAKNLGLNIDELASTLGVLANRGIKGEEAGTALNSIFVNLLGTTSTTRSALSELGVTVFDLQGNFVGWENLLDSLSVAMSDCTEEQQNMLAAALGGKTQLDTLLALLSGYTQEYYNLKDSISDIYSVDEFGNQITILEKMQQDYQKTLIGQFEVLKSQINYIFIGIGRVINENFGGALSYVNGKIEKLINFAKSLDSEQRKNIVKVGLLVAALGPLVLIIGKVTNGIARGIKTFNNFHKAMSNAGGFIRLFTNPLGLLQLKILLIVGVIALIGVAIYQLIKNWEKIKTFFSNFADKIAAGFESVFVAVGTLIGCIFNKAIQFLQDIFTFFKNIFRAIFDTVATFLSNILDNIYVYFNNIYTFLVSMLSDIFTFFNVTWENIKSIFSGVIDFITGVFTLNWKQAWTGIKNIFIGIWEQLRLAFKTPLNFIISGINSLIQGLNGLFSFKLPSWLGGKEMALFTIPKIPKLFTGTHNWGGGSAVIHDKGAEIVDLPNGSRVYPHDNSLKMSYEAGTKSKGNASINLNIESLIVREDSDIDKIIDKLIIEIQKERLNLA